MESITSPIAPERLKQAKWAYTTRRVDPKLAETLLQGDRRPRPGDLVLAQVDRLGQHSRLELVTSRRATMFEGDEIVVAYGNRYAPDQFEATIPEDLGACNLVAAGGVASRQLSRHNRVKGATKITPLGLLGDKQGRRINLAQFAMKTPAMPAKKPYFLVVCGTSMNSGKTTACASLVKGMVRNRFQVAAAKITGTGAGADYRILVDAGADPVLDFIDAGYVSTYKVEENDLRAIIATVCGKLARSKSDIVILEVADGLLQRETARIFQLEEFRKTLDGVIFAANDALGAQSGVAWLEQRALPVIGVTGVLTSSPLARLEAEGAVGLPVYDTTDLARAITARNIYHCLETRREQEKGGVQR